MKKKALFAQPYSEIFIPGIYLGITLVLDYQFPYTTITPLFGISGLMVFAFRIRPKWMIFWAIIYVMAVGFIFLNPPAYRVMNSPVLIADPVTPWLRTLTFLLGATISSMLCITINRLKKAQEDMIDLLWKVPLPLVTSDANGKIYFMNGMTSKLVGLNLGEHSDRNYFDLFSPKARQGSTISEYLKRFGAEKSFPPLDLYIQGSPYQGETINLSVSTPPLLLTILKESK